MKLFMVTDGDRWGYSVNLVRAESKEEAINTVRPPWRDQYGFERKPNLLRIEVQELDVSGDGPKILWCHDESPDTPNRDD